MIRDALEKVLKREHLSRDEAAGVMGQIADGEAPPMQVAALLAALRTKGETPEEIAGAADAMRARLEPVRVTAPVFVDTCGTGGDGLGTFNVSTTAAFVVAGAGVVVAKHGNRAVSSKSGSADVLAELGVNVDLELERVEQSIERVGIGFLFAPRHHPAFRHVAPVRRELGTRTVFNVLGPLLNPAGARRQVLGVYSPALVQPIAEVLRLLGAEHAMVVHGDGLDELTPTATTHVAWVRGGDVTVTTVEPEQFGIRRHTRDELLGGDAKTNARIALDVLEGQTGAPREAVVLNAAAALVVADAAANLEEGVVLARRSIDSGAARAKLAALVAETTS